MAETVICRKCKKEIHTIEAKKDHLDAYLRNEREAYHLGRCCEREAVGAKEKF